MARKIKSQKFTQFKFPSLLVIGLLLLIFVYVMYNQYKEGATDASVTDTKNVIPAEISLGKTGNNAPSNSIPTSTQIQARELVKKWQDKLVLDKKENNTLAAEADQYNIDFYKSMS